MASAPLFEQKGGTILNPITILLTATAPPARGTQATSYASSDGDLFKSQLDVSTNALSSGAPTATATASAPNAPASEFDRELQRAREELDRGVPPADVANQFAGSLATSIAAALGISVDAAKQRLTQVFAEALAAPDGTGPPGTNAERVSALVARFRQIAELATRVAQGNPGQPIRSIAGTSLDADSAKANPALSPDTILGDALAGDGRTVTSSSLRAISSGGDTSLGRTLARAVLADAQRSGAASGDGSQPGEKHATALDAFVHAFASALARESTRSTASREGGLPAALPASTSASSGSPAMPFAIPIAHDVAAIAPPVPTSSLPSNPQPVDANAIVDQVLRGISLRTSDGSSTLRLRLVPENLGDVNIKLVVTDGRVDATLTAHSVDAQSALAGGQNQLARTLADAGLKLQSFSVGLAGGAFADARDHANQHAWTRSSSRRIGGVDAADLDENVDSSLLAVPTFGPPIYLAHPNQWGVEYLV